METKYKIGYIDENEDQVKLYKRKFRDFGFEVIGYEFVKGMSLESLMDQVYDSDIDLLMIDYKLKETNVVSFNGEAVESRLYDMKPQFPYIIFTNFPPDAEDHVGDLKHIFSKSEITAEGKDKNKFVKMLEKSIEQYKNHINHKKQQISALLIKNEKDGLTSIEKNNLLELQEELQKLDKSKRREIPLSLKSVEKLEDLSKTRKEAEAFLENLIKERKDK